MIINNISSLPLLIEPLSKLDIKGSDIFYIVEVIKRRKDNPEMDKAEVLIKLYYLNIADIGNEELWNKIIAKAEDHGARVYFRYNPRSYNQVACKMVSALGNLIENGNTNQATNLFDRTAGSTCYKKLWWMIDFDGTTDDRIVLSDYLLDQSNGFGNCLILDTVNGCHYFFAPTDPQKLSVKFPRIDLRKDNSTLVYFNRK